MIDIRLDIDNIENYLSDDDYEADFDFEVENKAGGISLPPSDTVNYNTVEDVSLENNVTDENNIDIEYAENESPISTNKEVEYFVTHHLSQELELPKRGSIKKEGIYYGFEKNKSNTKIIKRIIAEKRVSKIEMELIEEDEVISKFYINATGYIRDLNNQNWNTRIRFVDLDYKERFIDISSDILLNSRELLNTLARNGFCVSNLSDDIVSFLRKRIISTRNRITSVRETGWVCNSLQYITPTWKVANPGTYFELQDSADIGISHSGNLEDWKAKICKFCVGNHILTISLCSALLGVLLKFQSSVNTTILHLVGSSSIGKTTALQVASSVWGNKKFIKQWRMTGNGLEATASKHNDSLLILDELSQISSKNVSEVFYMLGNESGKGRMKSDASSRKVQSWKMSVLSSGEVSISDKIAESGEKTKAGLTVRGINIDCNETHGIFNELHGFASGADLSNYLKEECGKHYGVVAKAFVTGLVQDTTYNDLQNKVRAGAEIARDSILKEFDLKDSDGQVKRVADIFALYLVAGAFACSLGIITHTESQLRESCFYIIDKWLKDRGGKESMEEKDVVDTIETFLLNNESRFDSLDQGNKFPPPNKLGYIKREKQLGETTTTYYVIPKLFKDEICRGLNNKIVKKVLTESGAMNLYADGKNPMIETKDGRKRFVTISFKNNEQEIKN